VCVRWLEVLPTYAPENPEQLVFPLPSGTRVQPGEHPLYKSVKVKVDGQTKARKLDLFRKVYLPARASSPRRGTTVGRCAGTTFVTRAAHRSWPDGGVGDGRSRR
jgi:hypothetical protein